MKWIFEGRQIGVKMTESLVRKPQTMVDFHTVRERERVQKSLNRVCML